MDTYNGTTGLAEADVKTKIKTTAQEATDKVVDKSTELKDKALDQTNEKVDTKTTEAAEQVDSVATALRDSSDQIQVKQIADFANSAADQIEKLANYLRDVDGEKLVNNMQSMARQSPWGAAGVGALTGFALARVLKATAPQDEVSHRQINTGYYGATERIDEQARSGDYGPVL